MTDTIAIFTTTATEDDARRIAGALVERRLAACVQVSAIESFYAWEGEVRQEPEFRLMAKTTRGRYADVEAAIQEQHSYDLPAIYALPMSHVFEPYADWVAANSAGQ